jgi:hypothetical protein
MIISYSKNFIYVHLDKCGGTSIEQSLFPYLKKNDIQLGTLSFEEDEREINYKKNNLRKHSTIKEIKKYLGKDYDSMYTFTTVRDPVDIMVSLYYYVKQNFKENIDDVYFSLYKKTVIENSGIDGFIKEVIQKKFSSAWTITSRIDNSIELFDIADIDNHWPYILKKLKIESNVKLNKLNKSIKPDEIILQKSTIDLIHDFFKIDYDTIPKITGHKWK